VTVNNDDLNELLNQCIKKAECDEMERPLDTTPDPPTVCIPPMEAFQKELEGLINNYSIENICDIPDYMLAEHICNYIKVMADTINQRDKWFGFSPFGEKEI